MKSGYSHLTMLVDRSGSMSQIATDAQGAVNAFVADQQKVPGSATLLLVDFDAPMHLSAGSEDWYRVVHDGDIATAPAYELKARGNTALLDAIGRAITSTGERLAAMPEEDRPEHVYFVCQTDGMENSSRDFDRAAVTAMIKTQTDEFDWQFVFLGMGPDSFGQGHALGFGAVTKGAQSGESYMVSYANTSDVVSAHRSGVVHDMAGANVDVDDDGTIKSR